MSDPQMIKANVAISYEADDGYESTESYAAPDPAFTGNTPKSVMLCALEELARLTALFGWEAEALEKFTAARERVAKYKEGRGS